MPTRRRTIAALLLLLGGAAALAAPKIGARKPEFVGAYDVRFVGDWVGDGHANVHPGDVKVMGNKVVDPAGEKVQLKFNKVDLIQGRFNGEGTADGDAVFIRGRVEEQVTGDAPRITGLVFDPAKRKYGRFVGIRKGA